MQTALVCVCSLALESGARAGEADQDLLLRRLLEGPRLLRWFIPELLRSVREEIHSIAQVGPVACMLALGCAEQCAPTRVGATFTTVAAWTWSAGGTGDLLRALEASGLIRRELAWAEPRDCECHCCSA